VIQISEYIFCDDFINQCSKQSHFLPNPYHQYPFLIIQNFLAFNECNLIAKEIQKSSEADKAMVKTTMLSSIVVPSIDEKIRKTSLYKLPQYLEDLYQTNFLKHQQNIEEYFSVALTTATKLQTLEYKTGDFYMKHADDSSEIIDKNGNTAGFICVAPQRKLTSIVFLSSHVNKQEKNILNSFEGGELIFNYLYDANGDQVTLRPKAGDMIVFPSNPYFSHEVKPVISGYRATLVQWHNGIF
jgi:SM-20-related protein